MSKAVGASCLRFRLETLAPSGGWLASLVVGLAIRTGIFDYTILATVFMFSFIILRTASCESAMVLALAYDLVIPFQYQNAQVHLKELEKYWPKFITGTMIEAACYLVLFPDLFNLVVIIKTSVLLVLWMRGKKQWPLVFPNKIQAKAAATPKNSTTTIEPLQQTQPPSQNQRTQPRSSSSSSPTNAVTPEYLDFVKKELGKCTGENALSKTKIQSKLDGLQQPEESQLRRQAEASLKKRNIPTFEVWKAAQGGSGTGSESRPSESKQGKGPNSQGPTGGTGTGTAPGTGVKDRLTEKEVMDIRQKLKDLGMPDEERRRLQQRLCEPFNDPDWERARKELEAAGVKLPAHGGGDITTTAAAEPGAGPVPGTGPVPDSDGQSRRKAPPAPAPEPPLVPADHREPGYPQYEPPSTADVKHIKQFLSAAGSSFTPEAVIAPLLAGPSHPDFSHKLNYLRYKGMNTRKWVPMAPNKTMYRLDDGTIDKCMGAIDDIANLRKDLKASLVESLTSSHETVAELNEAIKDINKIGLFTLEAVEEGDADGYKIETSAGGHVWYDYLQRRNLARAEGLETVEMLGATYDFLCDPRNKPNSQSDRNTVAWWKVMNDRWDEFASERKDVIDNDWIVGKAGIPAEEMIGYRTDLEYLGLYPQSIIDAILRVIKSKETAQEARELFKLLIIQSATSKGAVEVVKVYENFTKEALKYEKELKKAEEQEKKERANAAEPGRS